jgi:uncharacterized protein
MKKSYYNIEIEVDKGLLLYNVLSRGFALLDKEYTEFYRNEKLWKGDEKKLKEFLDNGFIVENDDKEIYLKRFKESQEYHKKNLNIVFVPTQYCNFNCFYCFEKNKRKEMDGFILQKSIDFVFYIIEKNKNLENVELNFFGGEPLLKIDEILRFGKSIKEICISRNLNFISSIITNGYFLTPQICETLYKELNLRFIQVTFDGDKYFHNKRRNNSYEILTNNLNSIGEKNFEDLKITIRVQVDKENIQGLRNLLIDLKNFDKYRNFSVYFARILGEYEENLIKDDIYFNEKEFGKLLVNKILPLVFELDLKIFELYPYPRAGGCSFTSENCFVIDADGSLKECFELVGSEEKYGSIFEIGKNFEKKLNKFSLPHFCENCKVLPLCNGSCPLRRLKNEIKCSHFKFCLVDYLKKIYEYKKEGFV